MLGADELWFLLALISLGHAQALCLALLLGRDSEHRAAVMFPQLPWSGFAVGDSEELGWRTFSGVLLTALEKLSLMGTRGLFSSAV